MTGSPATRQLLTGLFRGCTDRGGEAGEIGLPAPASPFLWPLLTTVFFFPGASEPAHQTGGFSRGNLCLPTPWELPGPLALGHWPALVKYPPFGGCLKAASPGLILPKASGWGTPSRPTLTWVSVQHRHLPALGPAAIDLTSPSLYLLIYKT